MTITKEQLSEAELACLEFYEHRDYFDDNQFECVVMNVGKAIHEKLNAKKKVDYSVLVKHKIDCVDCEGRPFIPQDSVRLLADFSPRTDYWFSALNFEDPRLVIEELEGAGFDVDKDCDEWNSIYHAFKINGAAEGYEL